MTILNLASDGLYPELIALFRAVAKYGAIEIEELVRICSADHVPRAALTRWTDLGLFVVQDKTVQIDERFATKRGESLESVTKRLPAICRKLILEEGHCLPIWNKGGVTEEGTGRTADFARGLAWTLSQDIYNFSDVSADAIETVEHQQIKSGKFIFLNRTRWPGLRSWARYLGFGVGDERTFLIDPTLAVREELPSILNGTKAVPADVFLNDLSVRLPVLDNGIYRNEVESSLNEETWRRVLPGHLSMSLSLALRRLELDKTIALDAKADAGQGVSLTGRNYRTWTSFTHIRLMGGRV